MIFPIKRKTLPEIAKIVGLDQEQSQIIFSQHLLGSESLRKQRLDLILRTLKEENFLIIDAPGDKKEKDRLCQSIFRKLGKI